MEYRPGAAVKTARAFLREARHFRRMWREAMPEDRGVIYFLAGYAAIITAIGLWLGS